MYCIDLIPVLPPYGRSATVADPGNRKGGFQTIEREARGVTFLNPRETWVMPTSGAVKLGEVPSWTSVLRSELASLG